ncbi:MAG TPA: hypothetical protein VGR26_14810 [Acidimicrobiales bacterium]|nr:hypothetical protein [Acidimicrobiales bacterium]
MGVLTVTTSGSFPTRTRTFGAITNGHAHAVAEAIRFLADEVLPAAIEQDHQLHDQGSKPRDGFGRPHQADDIPEEPWQARQRQQEGATS